MRVNAEFKGALIVAALLTTFCTQQAQAVPLVLGVGVPPTPAALPGSSVVGTASDSFSTGGGLALMTGTVTTTVYAPDLAYNPLGGLIFTYDIHIATALTGHTLQSLGLIDWSFLADARQTAAGAQAAEASLGGGGTIHFNFNPAGGTSTFGSGDSATLILATDAKVFKDSLLSVQDGLADNAATLAPSTLKTPPPVPDGSLTVVLLGIGILGLGVFRRAVLA